MKTIILTLLVLTVCTWSEGMGKCYGKALEFKTSSVAALENRDAELIIDDMEKVIETYPSLLEACGADEKAEQARTELPPACSKILAKEAKILVKIFRLNIQDKAKNQNSILMCT